MCEGYSQRLGGCSPDISNGHHWQGFDDSVFSVLVSISTCSLQEVSLTVTLKRMDERGLPFSPLCGQVHPATPSPNHPWFATQPSAWQLCEALDLDWVPTSLTNSGVPASAFGLCHQGQPLLSLGKYIFSNFTEVHLTFCEIHQEKHTMHRFSSKFPDLHDGPCQAVMNPFLHPVRLLVYIHIHPLPIPAPNNH